ncbi:hypothetical protein PAPYR_13460 [Paratrimastix pyriformis]|uniref:DDE-1 domain-containing protein n=1 Tax=Paratrimastix pyriformis TaxID=342808 RepID=A0ABQ8U4B9_9EUKA|nr:hypothetical protein PAPYR_13460 [Paratrimastix pyriformis]
MDDALEPVSAEPSEEEVLSEDLFGKILYDEGVCSKREAARLIGSPWGSFCRAYIALSLGRLPHQPGRPTVLLPELLAYATRKIREWNLAKVPVTIPLLRGELRAWWRAHKLPAEATDVPPFDTKTIKSLSKKIGASMAHARKVEKGLAELLEPEHIECVVFPAHTSHLVQPLDRSVFGAYKEHFKKMYRTHDINWETVDEKILAENRIKLLVFFHAALQVGTTIVTVQDGWNYAGLSPFNRAAPMSNECVLAKSLPPPQLLTLPRSESTVIYKVLFPVPV